MYSFTDQSKLKMLTCKLEAWLGTELQGVVQCSASWLFLSRLLSPSGTARSQTPCISNFALNKAKVTQTWQEMLTALAELIWNYLRRNNNYTNDWCRSYKILNNMNKKSIRADIQQSHDSPFKTGRSNISLKHGFSNARVTMGQRKNKAKTKSHPRLSLCKVWKLLSLTLQHPTKSKR